MDSLDEDIARITARMAEWPDDGRRRLIAVAGPPGAGKSTLAEALTAHLETQPGGCALVPMDGFHLDNAILDARGERARKGAPHTFDVLGFHHLLSRLREGKEEVFVPRFDRAEDLARMAAAVVPPETRLIVVEGNYLLLDEAPWTAMAPLFDLTVFLAVEEAELEARLLRRWDAHGWSRERALAHLERNDLPNVRHVLRRSRAADVTIGHCADAC